MKLALVVNKFPSLSETFIYTKAVALRRAGVDVTVIAATPTEDAAHFTSGEYDGPIAHMDVSRDLPLTARHLAARVARMSGRELRLWEAARQRYGMSRRALRAWVIAMPLAGYDILHIEYTGQAVAYLDALRLLDAKLVVSCRGTAERMTPIVEPARAKELGEMFGVVDRVHCVSQDLLETCVGYGLDRAKAFVNNPAIDLDRFQRTQPYPARRAGFRIVSTGRLHWAKGIEWGVLAVRELVAQGLDVHYDVIGGGPEEGRLRFLIADLGLGAHVTLAGKQPRTEVRRALEAADVYLLPSVSEGISNAALEAMAMEMPVVSTDVGGMREAIGDEEGRLVPSRAPKEMAAAIADLLRDPDLRTALGRAGRRRIERQFTVERQTRQFMAEYRALAP